MTLPIQDEPESTVGRKPSRWPHDEGGSVRQGAGTPREAGEDRAEGGPGGRDRARGEPPVAPGSTTERT